MKMVLMRISSWRGIQSLNWTSLLARQGFLEELGCTQLSCWPSGSHGNHQTTQADAKTKGCSLQSDSKTCRRGQHPRNSMHVIDLVPGVFILCSSLFGAGRYTAGYSKRNVYTKLATKPLTYITSPAAKYARQWWHQTCGSSQPVSDYA